MTLTDIFSTCLLHLSELYLGFRNNRKLGKTRHAHMIPRMTVLASVG